MTRPRGDWSQSIVVPTVLISCIAIVAVLVSFSNQSEKSSDDPVTPELESFTINEKLPETITVLSEQNQKVSLSSLIAQPTLVTLWTTTCNECLTALTKQQEIARTKPGIAILPVNFREDLDSVKDYYTKNEIELPMYFDPEGKLFNDLQATIPASYYVENGIIRYYFPGRITDDLLEKLFALR